MNDGTKVVFSDLLTIGKGKRKKLIEQVDNDDTKGYYITKWGASKNPPYNTTNFLLKKVDKFDDLLDELLKVFEGEEFKINNILEVTCYETDENGKEVEIEKSDLFSIDIV